MADQDNLTLQLTVQTAKALQAMQEFQSVAEKALTSVQSTNERLNSSFGSLKAIAEAAIAAFAIEKVASYFTESIRLAGEQEATLNRLDQSMANTGEYSDVAAADMKAFADQIQATTTFSNQAILTQLAVAKGFGLTNDESKSLVKAATELSAALGIGLDQAVLQLQKTLSGTLVRLGEQYPALKQFSAAQLEAGAAVKFFADGLGTIAEGQIKTYEGAMAQAANAHADFRRSLGEVITENPIVMAAIKAFTGVFRDLKTEIDDNHEGLSTLVSEGIKAVAEGVPAATTALQFMLFALEGLVSGGGHAIADFEDLFAALGETIYAVVGPAVDLIGRLEATILDMAGSMPGVSDAASAMGVNLKALAAAVDENREDFADTADTADKAVRLMAQSTRESTDSMVKQFESADTGLQKMKDTVDAAAKTVVDANASEDESARQKYENSGKYSRGAIANLKAVEEEQKAAAEFEKKLNQDALNAKSPADKAEVEWKSALEQIDKFVKDGVYSWQRGEEDKAKATSTFSDKIIKVNKEAADKAQKDAERQAQALAQFLDGLDRAGASDVEKLNIQRDDQMEKIQKFEDAQTISHEEATARRLQIDEQYAAKRNELFSQNPLDVLDAVGDKEHPLTTANEVAASIGGLNVALQGASGAANLIASGIGKLADTALPGIGGAVTSLVQQLEQGPEATKKFIEQFIQAIPDIMEAVSEAMPEVVDGFVDAMVNKGGAAKIAEATVEAMVGIPEMKQIGKDWGVNFGDSLNSPKFSKTVHGWFSGVEQNFGKLSAANFAKGIQGAGKELERIPGLISSEIFTKLPGQVRQGFDESIVDLRKFILEIPGDLRAFFTGEVPKAFTGAFDGIENFFKTDVGGFLKSGGDQIGASIKGIFTGIENDFSTTFSSVLNPIKTALDSFHFPEIPTPTWLKDFIDSVNHLTGSGGGGGGFVSDLKKGQVDLPGGHSIGVNGFHAAGLSEVPSGFPNDSYIGGLSTGEGVLDAQTNPAVKKMAQSYEADRSAMLAILGQLVTLMQQPQSVPVQLKVGTDVLATAMLKVSRTNQRVSA